ncbi:MAG: PQQ-binding-like beta-propeller repeat protein [Actinomycetota bacterium]
MISAVVAVILALAAILTPLLLFWPSHEQIVVDEGSWTMPGGGPAHLFYLPFAPRGPLVERWNTRLEGQQVGPAAVADGRTYVSCENGYLYCLDLESGKPVWRYDAAAGLSSMPSVSGAGIFLGTQDGRVLSVSPEGETNWEVVVGGTVNSTPIPVGDRVYFGSSDRSLYCVDAAGGSVLWSFEALGPVEVSPCIDAGQVFAVSVEGDLFALDERDGRLLWTYRTQGVPVACPAAADGKVFLAGEFELHCADAQSGKVLWEYPTAAAVISNLAVRGNQLLVLYGVPGGDASIVSLDDRTGDLLWQTSAGAAAEWTWLYASNEDAYYGGAGGLRAVAIESGIPSLERDLEGVLPGTMTITEDYVLAGSDSRKVYCYGE